ncbi:MAG: HD domain-containing protein [Stenotrophomonas sp.]|uniref:HD domain-containing protein n=1 Tax=Stenotrophomonas sp. TaxID=69392 RepID=UPI003D6CEC59
MKASLLTDKFIRAIDYARIAHAAHVRKGSNTPYIYHPLSVTCLIIEFGGNEDQAIAGVLHDVVEDCGGMHEHLIKAQFGSAVANIVMGCSDSTAEQKVRPDDARAMENEWLARKRSYLEHLRQAAAEVILVSACDKLHNARTIVQDLENPAMGLTVFKRFKGGTEGTLQYYQALSEIFDAADTAPALQIRITVTRMRELTRNLEAASKAADSQAT